MKRILPKITSACVIIGLGFLVLFSTPVRAEEARVVQEEAGVAPISGMQIEQQNVPTASSKAPAGLLPIPDYSANIWTRRYLTGDWGVPAPTSPTKAFRSA